MLKIMPSPRHTKSEEHLDSTITTAATPPSTTNGIAATSAVKIHVDRVSDSQTFAASPSTDPTHHHHLHHRQWNENG